MQCLSYFNELNGCVHNLVQKEVLLVFTYEMVNIYITYELHMNYIGITYELHILEKGNKLQCQYTMQSLFFTVAQ